MFNHRNSRCGDDDRRHGGNVDRLQTVSAGAHDIEDLAFDIDRKRMGNHGLSHASNLRRRFAFGSERREKTCQLGRGCCPVHRLIDRPRGLLAGQVLTADKPADDIGPSGERH